MNKKIFVGLLIAAVALLSVACGGKDEPVFSLSGVVEASFTGQSLEAMEPIEVEFTEKDGSVSAFTGVPIAALLSESGVSDYSKVTMIASDGYSAEVTAEELSACSDCVVAPDGEGGFRTVMPGFSGKLQVKDLVELKVE